MKTRNLYAILLGASLLTLSSVGWSQQPAAGQGEPALKAAAKAQLKSEPAGAARKTTGQPPRQDGQPADPVDRRERAAQVSGSMQKKANDAASAAASNLK